MATLRHSRSKSRGPGLQSGTESGGRVGFIGPAATHQPTDRPGSRKKYWSADVTQHSNALDLEWGVFTWDDPRRIAESLKRSAETSKRRKGTPLQSAMSMLNFYINRAGTNLSAQQRRVLERAKDELRALFNEA